MKILTSLAFLILLAFFADLLASTDVVYGPDDRVDVNECKNKFLVESARATAAMISPKKLIKNGQGDFQVIARPLKEYGICPDEKFSHQPAAADCSGFLVGENLLATAGHCVQDLASCRKSKWVFGFSVLSEEQKTFSIPASDVFSCKRIVSRELDPVSKNDFALIELDRPVKNRVPLKIRKEGKPSKGMRLAVIGHPSGLPTKIAAGAVVRNVEKYFFVANLDTFAGNSGSPVINTETKLVEGILVRGAADYMQRSGKSCQNTNYYGDLEGRGEDVTYIGNLKRLK